MVLNLNILNDPKWGESLKSSIFKQDGWPKFVGSSRSASVIPSLENTFRALTYSAPEDVEIVIFGQDPYPRRASAVGVAFWDKAVVSWQKAMSPSLRNIVKSLMIHQQRATAATKVDALRSAIAASGLVQPPAWFPATGSRGVLWLNTSLTFESAAVADLRAHAAFWRPVVLTAVETVLRARQRAGKGVVFVLWGGYAHKLRPGIEERNAALPAPCAVRFVEGAHPAVEAFHKECTFSQIAAAQRDLGLAATDFMVAEPRAARSSAAASFFAPKAKKQRR